MKKIYLLLVNSLLITSAVGVTALTVAGCNDKDKDKDKVKDEDVIKALKDFNEKNPLDIPYLGITKDTSAASAVADNLKKRLSDRNATIFTEAVKKEITFGDEPLDLSRLANVTVTYKKIKPPITIKVKEAYGTEIVTNILKPYSEEGKALAIEYLGDDTAKKTSDTTLLSKVHKILGKDPGLSKALIAQINIAGSAEVTPGKTVSILAKYPGNGQGASINIRENGTDASKALAKLSSKKDAPLALEHLGIEKEGATATSLAAAPEIRTALKKFSGTVFTAEILKKITFDSTHLAPGRMVEVATTYSYDQDGKQLSELTYIYIREKYDVEDVKTILEKYSDASKPVGLDFIKEGDLEVNDPDVVKALKDKLQKDNDKITSLTVAPMSFSSTNKLSAGSKTAIDVTVTFPGNTRSDADGTYNTEKATIKVKEAAAKT